MTTKPAQLRAHTAWIKRRKQSGWRLVPLWLPPDLAAKLGPAGLGARIVAMLRAALGIALLCAAMPVRASDPGTDQIVIQDGTYDHVNYACTFYPDNLPEVVAWCDGYIREPMTDTVWRGPPVVVGVIGSPYEYWPDDGTCIQVSHVTMPGGYDVYTFNCDAIFGDGLGD